MIRLLVLDDNQAFFHNLARRVRGEKEPCFVVQRAQGLLEARQMVANMIEPFDIFLIDLRLKSKAGKHARDVDGIEVMEELCAISPTSEAIIISGDSNPNTASRAYQAGASRYFSKDSPMAELLFTLRSLYEKRRAEEEREWLKILTDVAEQTQRSRSVREVAQVVIKGGRRLGFERVRLWLLDESKEALVGVCQVGTEGLADFTNVRIPINESPYLPHILNSHEPSFLQGTEWGAGYLHHQYGDQGWRLPVGEWVSIPLWSSDECLGKLTLDYADRPIHLRPAQRDFLRLFGKQVSAAIVRVHLAEKEARKSRELYELNQLAQNITDLAAHRDLDSLLCEVRHHVGQFMDVSDFTIALLDEETHALHFRLHYENNQRLRRHWGLGSGLIWYVISQNESLFLADGINNSEFRKAHPIPLSGRQCPPLSPPPKLGGERGCWMGVPLCVAGQAVGAIVIQSYDKKNTFTQEDLRLLTAVANQLAGVIQTARRAGRDAKNAQQLSVLHGASEILMTLAQEEAGVSLREKEERVWHATLTVATAHYGLRFNRAALFLVEQEGRAIRLRGRMGIGHFCKQDAEQDWRRDKKEALNLEKYLELLRAEGLNSTPMNKAIRDVVIELDEHEENVFSEVLRSGQHVLIRGAQKALRLPSAFQTHFDSLVTENATCAVLPLQGAALKGLLVVDNAFTKKPVWDSTLKHLQPLLNQAALTVENLRQRQIREALLDANYAIMAGVSDQPLGQSLTQICQAAQAVMGADMVMIYPLKQKALRDYRNEYDFDNIGQIGRQSARPLPKMMTPSATASHILRSGFLVVSDVSAHATSYEGQTLSEHALIQEESIKAFIGLAIKDSRSGATLGVQFFDYRKKRTFTEQDLHLAGLFANLAAVAIHNANTADQIRKEMQDAQLRGEANERELFILRRVLEEALANTDEEKLVKTLFNAAHDLLLMPDLRLILMLRKWEQEETPREVRYHYLLNPDGSLRLDIQENLYRGMMGLTLKEGQTQLADNVHEEPWRHIYYNDYPMRTQSELDVPIKLGKEVIGVFNAESPQIAAFTPAHQATFERLAAVAALALNNVRRQTHLYSVLKAAEVVTSHLGLKETLDEVVQAARQAAPDMSLLTIWYRQPENQQLVLGPHFGVRHEERMFGEQQGQNSVVWTVMHEPEPIWAPVVCQEPRLNRRFVKEEQIISTAAFPLRVADEEVGAMFFGYRQPHHFSSEEKALFPILAEIVADSVRDAAQLEATQKERDRLHAAMAITDAVGTTLDLNDTLHQVMAVLRNQLFPDTNIGVTIYNEAEQVLEFASASKEFYNIDNRCELEGFRISYDARCIACRVAKASLESKEIEIMNVPNVKDQAAYLPLIRSTQSEIAISLLSTMSTMSSIRTEKRLLGVLVLESPILNRFKSEDEALLRHVSQKISLAIERANQSAELQFHTTIAATTSWAAEIAHDIRNEVGHILNRAYWLIEDGQLTEQERLYVHQIEESAEKLAWTGKSVAVLRARQSEALLIDEWIENSVRSIIAYKNKSVDLTFELGCPNLTICAVESALTNALRHLIRNALEAMEGSEEPESGQLIIRTKVVEQEQMVEVQIEDSGPGLDDRIRQTLFQKPKSTKDGEDRGFGLLFTRYAIQQMGGRVYCIPTTVLPGSCFAFTLKRQ
ncbi:MAG: GAF domain-containing protein [Ardenticatenaceae bacterium]